MPNSAEQAEAARRLEDLRKAVARYRSARQKTHQVVMNTKQFPPREAARRAHAMRDPDTEKKAAQALVDVNRVMLGRDPTEAELEVGVSGLGLGPLVLVPVLIGGAWTATSLFNFLSEREQTIQRELDPTSILGYGPASARWLLPAGLAAAGLVGGYLWLRSATKKKAKPTMKKNPWEYEDEDEDEEPVEGAELEEEESDESTE